MESAYHVSLARIRTDGKNPRSDFLTNRVSLLAVGANADPFVRHFRFCLDVLPKELFKGFPALFIVVDLVEPSQDDALVRQLLPVSLVAVPVDWHREAHIVCWLCPNHLRSDI